MTKIEQGKNARRRRWFFGVRAAQRFARRQDGTAAIEFAIVAAPFLALLFAIIETALVYFAGQVLEAATTDSTRLIMTGQAQTQGWNESQFKQTVCSRLFFFNCANLYLDIRDYPMGTSISTGSPITNGKIDPTKISYTAGAATPGAPGNVLVVTAYYPWQIYAAMTLANMPGGTRLLTATSVLRVEPYE
jgi:Flp pilus assembly protein TadG